MNMTRILPIVAAAMLFAAPAHATCLNSCKATLIGPGCATPTHAAAGDPIWFLLSCQTCCSPPGGPVNCTDIDPYSETFSVMTPDGKKVDGLVSPSQMACPGLHGAMFAFIPAGGSLGAGTYDLVYGSMILLEFDQFAAGGADSEAWPDTAADAGTTDLSAATDAAATVDTADAASLPDVAAAADAGVDAALGPDASVDTSSAPSQAAAGCQARATAPDSAWVAGLTLAGWILLRRRRPTEAARQAQRL